MLDGFSSRSFSAPLASSEIVYLDVDDKRDAYPCVAIIQELPEIGPQVRSLKPK